jgi:calreticulin
VHPEIDNPDYVPDANLYKYDDFGVLGFDLWQVKSGTIFDNVLITDDESFAEKVGEETWGASKDAEKKMKDAQDEEEKKAREEEEARRKEEEGDDDEEEDLPMDDMDEEDDEEEPEHDEL